MLLAYLSEDYLHLLIILIITIVIISLTAYLIVKIREIRFNKLLNSVLMTLGLTRLEYTGIDDTIYVKSAKAVDSYTVENYFKEEQNRIEQANRLLAAKERYKAILNNFLKNNEFMRNSMYPRIEILLKSNLTNLDSNTIIVNYTSPAGRKTYSKQLKYDVNYLNHLASHPELLMSKTEYNKFLKESNKQKLEEKIHSYYEMVNKIIDRANNYRDKLLVSNDKNELDRLISDLYDKTVNSIKKIKSLDSDEWNLISTVINNTDQGVEKIIGKTQKILDYYESDDFYRIKDTCQSLMESQKEFNEYINEKAQSISSLFGARIIRNETEINDEYNYIRQYKKSITPFTAEVSAQVFASAENNPLEYIVKNFYPNKSLYPEQIQKLQLLIEELETLKEAKQIIDNYKKDYQQYITDVPSYVMENDEDGFYTRLGFANISESILTVEYKFSYTSNGGMAQRSFVVPMTEETIIQLIEILQSKLTFSAFAKEQRALMTSKLRQKIKERDNYTCKYCGNSTHSEPNLLLEIDHIVPVAKGGCTVEDNLQTLCWKCNRAKSDKLA